MENNDPKLNAIISKLRKLQSLYEGAKKINSEAEAAAAATAIQRILTQYNLTMEQVGAAPEENPLVQEHVSGYTYKSIGGYWEQRLLSTLCDFNLCKCYFFGRSYKRLLIVGKKENIATVQWLRGMLSERYVAFSKDKYKEYVNTLPYGEKKMSMDRFQRAYLMGCADGLRKKLTEDKIAERRNDVNYSNQVTALTVRNKEAIEEFVNKQYGKVSYSKCGNRPGSYSAYGKGFTEGKRTQLNKPIDGTQVSHTAGLL